MHWSRRAKLRDDYQLLIQNQMSLNNITKTSAGEEYRIIIIAHRKRRIRDYDNLVGGCKQLLDALSRAGFIWDDDEKYIDKPSYIQEKAKDEEYTTIIRRKANAP
jgi:Holliday junction resolvase RusA-like endonuclease